MEFEEYCMIVYLFGGGFLLGCLNFAFKRIVGDSEVEFGVKVVETFKKNFYVDDVLKLVSIEEDVIEFVYNVKNMCVKGGFNFTKFVSNSRRVIMLVSFEDRVKEIKGLDLG